jgi:hypothetical protein
MEEVPVQELYDFAREVYPDYKRLPGYYGLQWRRRVGPKLAPYLQPFIWTAVANKVRSPQTWRRLNTVGY